MLLSLTDHDLGRFLEKHLARHTFASRDPQRSQRAAGNVSHSLKFSLQASPQEVKLFCSALQLLMHLYSAISRGGTGQFLMDLPPAFGQRTKVKQIIPSYCSDWHIINRIGVRTISCEIWVSSSPHQLPSLIAHFESFTSPQQPQISYLNSAFWTFLVIFGQLGLWNCLLTVCRAI